MYTLSSNAKAVRSWQSLYYQSHTLLAHSASLPPHFCFLPSLAPPLSHGHGFQYRSLVLKSIILWIVIVLLQWLVLTSFLLSLQCWKDAQRAPCTTASLTPAGRLLLTQEHLQACTCTALTLIPVYGCPSTPFHWDSPAVCSKSALQWKQEFLLLLGSFRHAFVLNAVFSCLSALM